MSNRKELRILHSMTRVLSIHVGHLLVASLTKQGRNKRAKAIFMGPYMTILMKELGIFDQLLWMLLSVEPIYLDMTVLSSMRMVHSRVRPHGVIYKLRGEEDPVNDNALVDPIPPVVLRAYLGYDGSLRAACR